MTLADRGTIFHIERFSIHDGPGIRTTVFLKGCPLSCWWCHNPESQSVQPELMYRENRCLQCEECLHVCPESAISRSGDRLLTDMTKCTLCGDCVRACHAEAREMVGRTMTVEQVVREIEKDLVFYDESGGGVTFSGGEPLLQSGFLLTLVRACKEREIHTAIDTSGLAQWTTLEPIAEHVDLILYDVKVMDERRHVQFTGVKNKVILDNLTRLAQAGNKLAIRMPLIPRINDDEQNFTELAKFASSLAHPPSISLLPYHKAGVDKYSRLNKPYALQELEPPSGERVAAAAEILQRFGLVTKVGG